MSEWPFLAFLIQSIEKRNKTSVSRWVFVNKCVLFLRLPPVLGVVSQSEAVTTCSLSHHSHFTCRGESADFLVQGFSICPRAPFVYCFSVTFSFVINGSFFIT